MMRDFTITVKVSEANGNTLTLTTEFDLMEDGVVRNEVSRSIYKAIMPIIEQYYSNSNSPDAA